MKTAYTVECTACPARAEFVGGRPPEGWRNVQRLPTTGPVEYTAAGVGADCLGVCPTCAKKADARFPWEPPKTDEAGQTKLF